MMSLPHALQVHFLRILAGTAGKTILHDGNLVEVVENHTNIRRVRVLLDADLQERNDWFWIPRRADDMTDFRNKRVKRQFASGIRRAHNQPCWTGDSYPTHNGVPLESISMLDLYASSTVEERTKQFLISIEAGHLLVKTTQTTRLMSAATRLQNLKDFLRSMVATKTKELMESLTVELLRRSRLSDTKINAVYEVMFDGTAVDVVARKRNLRLNALQQTLRRVRGEVMPLVKAELEAWIAQEPEVVAVHEEMAVAYEDT